MNDFYNITWARYETACNEMQTMLEENGWMENIKASAEKLLDAIKAVERAEDLSR
jgi:hypothetical protein